MIAKPEVELKYHLEQAAFLFERMVRGEIPLPDGKTHTDAVMEVNELNAALQSWGLVTRVEGGHLGIKKVG